jgi:hypothetical protein
MSLSNCFYCNIRGGLTLSLALKSCGYVVLGALAVLNLKEVDCRYKLLDMDDQFMKKRSFEECKGITCRILLIRTLLSSYMPDSSACGTQVCCSMRRNGLEGGCNNWDHRWRREPCVSNSRLRLVAMAEATDNTFTSASHTSVFKWPNPHNCELQPQIAQLVA